MAKLRLNAQDLEGYGIDEDALRHDGELVGDAREQVVRFLNRTPGTTLDPTAIITVQADPKVHAYELHQ